MDNHTTTCITFFGAFLAIYIISYYLEIYLYNYSLDYIENIRHWRPAPLVAFLHFCSYSGDFDTFWIIACVIWGFSKDIKRTYFINLFLF